MKLKKCIITPGKMETVHKQALARTTAIKFTNHFMISKLFEDFANGNSFSEQWEVIFLACTGRHCGVASRRHLLVKQLHSFCAAQVVQMKNLLFFKR